MRQLQELSEGKVTKSYGATEEKLDDLADDSLAAVAHVNCTSFSLTEFATAEHGSEVLTPRYQNVLVGSYFPVTEFDLDVIKTTFD